MKKLLSAALAALCVFAVHPAFAQVSYTDTDPSSGARITVPVTPAKPLPVTGGGGGGGSATPFLSDGTPAVLTLATPSTSGRVALPGAGTTAIITVNTGTAQCRFGNGAAVAVSTDPTFAAGSGIPRATGSAADIACISTVANTVTVETGSGTPSGFINNDLTAITATNLSQANGTTLATGNGVTGAGSPRVTIASDNTAIPANVSQIAGTTALTGNGATGAGSQRVTIANDNSEVPTKTADGSQATIGAKADAICVTATGTCTLQALIKYLNTAVNSSIPAGTAIIGKTGIDQTTDGTTNAVHLVAGTALAGKVGLDQTTPGTTNGVSLAQIGSTTILTGTGAQGAGSQRVTVATDTATVAGSASLPAGTNAVGFVTQEFDVATTITRPANTTAYTANDVLGGALDLGVLGTSAASVEIKGVQLEGDITAIPAGQTTWVLYLYNVTPPSATADNGAFDLPSGDRASFLGSIAIPTLVDLGSTLYVEANNLGKSVKLSGTHLFAYLVTVGAFTPAANSEVYKLTLHVAVK